METEPHSPDPSPAPAWRALMPLCLVAFAVMIHASAIGPLAAAIADDLGVTIPLIGQVSTLLLAAMAASGLLAGPLADHFGHRRTLLVALGLLVASAALMGLAPSYRALLAGGLVAGAGASALGLVAAIAAAHYHSEMRRVALSRIQAAQTSGAILGAPLLTAVAAVAVWRASYALVLGAYLTALTLVAWVLPRELRPAGRFTGRDILASYRPLMHDRPMLALYGASALRALGWLGPFLYLGAFFAERGLTLRQIGLAYMIASGGMFVGNLIAGRWLAGRDLRGAFATTTALLAAAWFAIYTLPLALPLTVAAVTLTAGVAGFGWIALTTLLAAETPAEPGTTMALNGTAFALGSALGGALGGLLVGLGGYTLLGIVLPATTLVAALLVWRPGVALRQARAAAIRQGTLGTLGGGERRRD